MQRILIANIFGIGDVLFTTPLIANLKRRIPSVRIDYLCNARTQDIIRDIPEVSQSFIYEKDDFTKLWRESKTRFFKSLYTLFSEIRRKRYDIVFDFTLSREFGLFFTLAGIRGRVGLDYKKRGLFLTDKKKLTGFSEKHVIEYYLDLLELIDVPIIERNMRLVPGESSVKWAENYLEQKGFKDTAFAAIVPGGGASWGPHAGRKRWGAENFSKAVDILLEKGIKIIILGDSSEEDLLKDVAAKIMNKPVVFENRLTLKEYIALLTKCALVLCNDGGPLHIAVALGIKTVSIFGPVDEKVYGPYPTSDRHIVFTAQEVECRPCYNRFKLPECEQDSTCLTGIDPHEVAETCLKLLFEKRF